jgi:hypothetical protein
MLAAAVLLSHSNLVDQFRFMSLFVNHFYRSDYIDIDNDQNEYRLRTKHDGTDDLILSKTKRDLRNTILIQKK